MRLKKAYLLPIIIIGFLLVISAGAVAAYKLGIPPFRTRIISAGSAKAGPWLESINSLWADKVEDAHWQDVPSDLRHKVMKEIAVSPQDVKAIEHVEFSSLTKTATLVIGVINQFTKITDIFAGAESKEDLATALVEKVAKDTAAQGGGKAGELVVAVYEGGKTGYQLGTLLAQNTWKTTLATSLASTVATQMAVWVLNKEMEYINNNTSKLFEFISLYDSGYFKRLNTYIFWYSKKESGRLDKKGVVLYYKGASRNKWVKGKDINVVSDTLLRITDKGTSSDSSNTFNKKNTSSGSSKTQYYYRPSKSGVSF